MLTLANKRKIPSWMRRSGFLMVQRSECPQAVADVKQFAKTIGPSIARITCSAEISRGSRSETIATVGPVF